mmetsp:Transcript_22434/g.48991  ORF Transcript_22434/g.48991 Transcript_22434/m.48991 type:complete len:214 (+) Transcript_22434:19-660(+)|eukprot:5355270-Pleurochrysis_carterae.AAC.4
MSGFLSPLLVLVLQLIAEHAEAVAIVRLPRLVGSATRRSFLATAFVSAVPATPARAAPTLEGISQLSDVFSQLDLFAKEAESFGPADSDYAFRFSRTVLAPAAMRMHKTAPLMSALGEDGQQKAAALSNAFADSLVALDEACRAKEPASQRKAVAELRAPLSDYLQLAGTAYSVPTVGPPPAFSAANYFGIFSCEGQGLERVPGSNNCIDRKK